MLRIQLHALAARLVDIDEMPTVGDRAAQGFVYDLVFRIGPKDRSAYVLPVDQIFKTDLLGFKGFGFEVIKHVRAVATELVDELVRTRRDIAALKFKI